MTALAEMKGCNGISMPFGMYRLISIDDADWKEVITRGVWISQYSDSRDLDQAQQKRKPNFIHNRILEHGSAISMY